MMTLGTFTQAADGAFRGAIRTLTLNARSVELRPTDVAGDKAPSFRVFAGPTEVGAAWTRTSKAGNTHLFVKLDDPSFAAPVLASLVEQDDAWRLIWSRNAK